MNSLTYLTLSLFLLYVVDNCFGNSDSLNKYQYKKTHHYSLSLTPFRRLYGLSLNACVYKCSIRKKCKSINYKSRSQTCELHASTGTPDISINEPSVYIEHDFPDNSCGCADNQVCTDTATNQCSIEECEPLTSVNNGKIYGNMNNVGAKLKVTCESGFVEKEGRTYTTCLDDGTWQFVPECVRDCGTPSIPQGSLSYDTAEYGSSAAVSCDLGYVASVANIACLDTGLWEPATCNAIECGTPSIANGSLSYGTSDYGSSAAVSCDLGYVASVANIACLDTGLWEPATCNISAKISQWVSSVESFSSEFDNIGYAATQIAGVPDVYPMYGDKKQSWAPKMSDANQYITVKFAEKVYVTALDIYETFHAGGVKQISALIPNLETGNIDVFPMYTGVVEDIQMSRIFSPTLLDIGVAVDTIRIDIDCSAADDYVELDAVQLHGTRVVAPDCGPIQYTNTNVTYVGGTVEGATVSVSFQNGVQTMPVYESISATCGIDGNWFWSTFAHFEEPAAVWELMFRGTAENGYNVTAAYLNGTDGITTSDPACMFVQNNSCSLHYRNPKLGNWSTLGVRKVRYEMYNDGAIVMSISVDGTGTTMDDWFFYGGETWRALQWPWTDLTNSSRGWWALSDWDVQAGRSFRIIRVYDSCDGDYYYTVVLYQPTTGCAYENHTRWPQFLYAKGNTGAYFESAEYGLASVMAVWVYHD